MFVLLYIVIPVIIAFFWFAVVTNLGSAQSATEFVLAIRLLLIFTRFSLNLFLALVYSGLFAPGLPCCKIHIP